MVCREEETIGPAFFVGSGMWDVLGVCRKEIEKAVADCAQAEVACYHACQGVRSRACPKCCRVHVLSDGRREVRRCDYEVTIYELWPLHTIPSVSYYF